jgi:hypothetical protein
LYFPLIVNKTALFGPTAVKTGLGITAVAGAITVAWARIEANVRPTPRVNFIILGRVLRKAKMVGLFL